MLPEAPLVADEVRAELFEALAPILDECAKAAEVWPTVAPENVRLVVQLHPLLVQIVVAAEEDRPARRIVAFSGERLPDGGKALGAAVEAVTAGIMAGIGDEAAGRVMTLAAVPEGGLCVEVDPVTEGVALGLALPGVGMEKAVLLGGIGQVMTGH
jgi:hypothetical protein